MPRRRHEGGCVRLAGFRARLILFGLWTVVSAAPGRGGTDVAEGTSPPANDFPAWAMPDCAPFDGPATLIHVMPRAVQAAEPPTVRISIWRPVERARGRRYILASDELWGAVTLCSPAGECSDAVAGEVRLEAGSAGAPIEGRYDLRLANGHRERGSFLATLREQLAYCG